MKKITLFLSLLLIGSVGFSQIIPGVNIGKRKEYMMRTYKINRIGKLALLNLKRNKKSFIKNMVQ